MSVADFERIADHLFWLFFVAAFILWMMGAFDRD